MTKGLDIPTDYKYFVGRMKDVKNRPYRVYNSHKFLDTDEVICRSNSLIEAKEYCKKANKERCLSWFGKEIKIV